MTYDGRPNTGPAKGKPALEVAAEYGVKYPKPLAAAIKALSIARVRASQATKIGATIRQDFDTQWLQDEQAHNDKEAATKDPQDFKPFSTPRPSLEHGAVLTSSYSRNLTLRQRDVEAAASDYSPAFETILDAWVKLPVVEPDTMTVSEAQAIEAENAAAKLALIEANMALAKLSGMMDEQSRKRLKLRQKQTPGCLISLDEIVAEITGRSPKTVAAEKAAAEAQAAAKAKTKADAQAEAKRRVGASA